jgi:hypothetical protein
MVLLITTKLFNNERYSHTSKVDYFEAFAHVVKYDSIHTMFTFFVKSMELLQFDVCTIFLNG